MCYGDRTNYEFWVKCLVGRGRKLVILWDGWSWVGEIAWDGSVLSLSRFRFAKAQAQKNDS